MLLRLLRSLLPSTDASLPAKAAALRAFDQACERLGPEDIAVDCGANVGKFTRALARRGAIVHAFEPNPDAFAALAKNTVDCPFVVLHNQAVGATAGKVRLYLHERAGEDPLYWSTGSSVLPFKGNITHDSYVDVESVDLSAFLQSLGRPVALLKIDVEGVEIEILNRLIDTGAHKLVRQMFVEVHDAKVPELREPTVRMRARLRELGIDNINLDWQ